MSKNAVIDLLKKSLARHTEYNTNLLTPVAYETDWMNNLAWSNAIYHLIGSDQEFIGKMAISYFLCELAKENAELRTFVASVSKEWRNPWPNMREIPYDDQLQIRNQFEEILTE